MRKSVFSALIFLISICALGAGETKEDILYRKAKALVDSWAGDSRDLQTATEYLQRILKSNPRYAPAYVQLARATYKSGYISDENYLPEQLKSANKLLDKAFEIDPKLFEAFIARSYIYWFQDDLANARKVLTEASRIRPGAPDVDLVESRILEKEGKNDEAIQKANLVIKKTADTKLRLDAYTSLSHCYVKEKDFDAAETAYLAKIKLAPTAWNKSAYACFLTDAGRFDEAIENAKIALKEMDFGAGHECLANAYYAKGADLMWKKNDPAGSVQYFQLTLTEDPYFYQAHFGLGVYYYKEAYRTESVPLLQKAEDSLRTALKIKPDFAQGKDLLKAVLETKKRVAGKL